MSHRRTPHYYAVMLTHERIYYGDFLEDRPDILNALKKAIFGAAKDLFSEALNEGIELPGKAGQPNIEEAAVKDD